MAHSAAAIPAVVAQHVEELASLWMLRDSLVDAGHAALRHLARVDERVAAHHDACVVAGAGALAMLNEQLGSSPGSVFAAAVVSLDLNDRATWDRCLAVAGEVPEARREVSSAIGWVSASRLRGIVKDMLEGPPIARAIGLAACRLHGVDPGPALTNALRDSDNAVRAEALRTAGVLSRTDLASRIATHEDTDAECQFWAAWSATLLGSVHAGRDLLMEHAVGAGPHQRRATHMLCQAMPIKAGHDLLRRLATGGAGAHMVIEGSGVVGDPSYVSWLIQQMSEDKVARAAGASFTLITGADIALLDLECLSANESPTAPTDDPDDAHVEVDADDGLPWPEPALVGAWWAKHQQQFQSGLRFFVGLPLARDRVVEVLKEGTQRQRQLAAQHLTLLNPGTPVFNTSAPAWRQQRRLQQV
jgi:uncharacterized protein (TIGR02270 family)